jgi:hypothetical protein
MGMVSRAAIGGGLLGLVGLLAVVKAEAQIVEPDIKKWSVSQCQWLHGQVLKECMNLDGCNDDGITEDLSMASQRGLIALEPVMTVRNRKEFNSICYRVCDKKSIPTYASFDKEFCSTIPRMIAPTRSDGQRANSPPQ